MADARAVSISPNGDVLGGKGYQKDIMDIRERYMPEKA